MPGPIKFSTYERSTALIKARFEKILTAVEAVANLPPPLSQVNLRTLSSYAKEITKKRADFEGNLQRVLEGLAPEEAPTSQLSTDQDDINDVYIKIQSIIESLNPIDEPRTPSAHSEPGSIFTHASVNIRLPKLELKHFDGNPLQWVSFINLFDSSVHKNVSVSNVAKFQYLLSVVSGEPLSLIKSLNITTANYLVAYQLLRDRYHNTRRLTTLHLNQIMDLPNITSGSLHQLRGFINLFYEHSEALKALDCDVSSNSNPLLSALILRKIDSEIRKKLEAYRSTQDHEAHTLPEVTEIIKFLNIECDQVEDAGLHLSHSSIKTNCGQPSKFKGTKSVKFSSDRPSKTVAMLTTHKTQSSTSCFDFGKPDHKIYVCPTFKGKTPQQRYQIVKKESRCISCLGYHDSKLCKSLATCYICHKRHHSLLHSHFQQPSADVKPHKVPKDNLSPAKVATAMTSQSQYSSESTVLLGTLLVQLTSPQGTTHVFRALLDSGSMCNFISERAAQLLGVKRTHSSDQITGIAQTATSTRGLTHLTLTTLSGPTMVTQHPFLILDRISMDLPRAKLTPEVFHKAKAYTLADPTFHLPSSVDVLLGGSLFPQLLTNESHSLGPNLLISKGS
ncbi:uncharacterized protein LOC129003486 [Macrosteles quadrilineatus]|uniref:uncharacterized protein LOC129003486 n=1 Tax=Macrosteles quadrilineatus TaxID=74068 RepID=UPI0023E21FD9|nr:uncharacterized protein LOC129003486 [Macrosteles quadrilineatus]